MTPRFPPKSFLWSIRLLPKLFQCLGEEAFIMLPAPCHWHIGC